MVSTEQVKSKLRLLDKMKEHKRVTKFPVPQKPFDYQVVCDSTNNPDIESDTITVDLFVQYHKPSVSQPIHYREETERTAPGGSITRAAVKAAVVSNLWSAIADTHMTGDKVRVEALAEDMAHLLPRALANAESFELKASVQPMSMLAHRSDSHLSIKFTHGVFHCMYETDLGLIADPNFYHAIEKAAAKLFTPRVLFHLRRR